MIDSSDSISVSLHGILNHVEFDFFVLNLSAGYLRYKHGHAVGGPQTPIPPTPQHKFLNPRLMYITFQQEFANVF